MTGLSSILERLDLSQYLEPFEKEGFDTWETVLDITEADLDALGVKRGHRRRLQREIANSKGIDVNHYLAAVVSTPSSEPSRPGTERREVDDKVSTSSTGKRKYRRHPKPDANAPERSPSAYVLFSNKVREDLKSENLSFTDIAKRVGENWQQLSSTEKALYENHAVAAKEKFKADLVEYKKTDQYRVYNEYLAAFKIKHGRASEEKRPRIDKEATTPSDLDADTDSLAGSRFRSRRRGDSLGSTGALSSTSGQPSPVSLNALKPSNFLHGTPAGHLTQASSSISTDRREPYQHARHAPQSDDGEHRESQGMTSRQLSRLGASDQHGHLMSPGVLGERPRDPMASGPFPDRLVGRDSFKTPLQRHGSSRASLLHQDSSESPSRYQDSSASSTQHRDTSSMSSARSSNTPNHLNSKAPSGDTSQSDFPHRPSLPPLSSIALRPSDGAQEQRHGFSLPPPQQMIQKSIESSTAPARITGDGSPARTHDPERGIPSMVTEGSDPLSVLAMAGRALDAVDSHGGALPESTLPGWREDRRHDRPGRGSRGPRGGRGPSDI